jgi:sorbitol-specific phosphotransferase system component IIC
VGWAMDDAAPIEHGGRTELFVYLGVAVVLVVAGVFLRSVLLNWIVGPLTVVVGVVLVTAFLERRRAP